MDAMRIGELARHAGVGADTVRFYEREGLLPAPPRSAAGYRRYGAGDIARVRFIRRAKNLGFTLEQIGELLSLSARRDVRAVKRAAEARLAEVERKIAELQRIRRGLRELVQACPGHGPTEHCPIVQALAGEEAA